MSEIDIKSIEKEIDNFVVKVVNLFCDNRAKTFIFASELLKNELLQNPTSWNDYHLNSGFIISMLYNYVNNNDPENFVYLLMCSTSLLEPSLKLKNGVDDKKIDNITQLCSEVYYFIDKSIESKSSVL
uniref:Uncharacterized protein n=1 Tax=viral metagenome TaxID=1070528 RepID=A0A6C0BE42_9ZZZZ